MRVALLLVLACLGPLLLLPAPRAGAQTSFPQIQVPPPPAAPPKPATIPPSSAPEVPLPGLNDPDFAGNPEADPNTSVILENADTFEQRPTGPWIGQGHVRVRYKKYLLTADRVEADLDSGETLFSGHVVLKAPGGQTVTGGPNGSLRLNLRRDTYTVTDARTTVPPESLNAGVILPVFVFGGVVSGRPGLIDARGSRFTTCDFLVPHYLFEARQVYILPGKRLVARHVTLYRKNHRLFTLPYFVAPLDQRFSRQTLTPELGQSADEGYYAKFAIGYALAATLPGILRLDALQKKGLGTGFEQSYGAADQPRRGSGLFSLYHLYDQVRGVQDLTGSLNHQQRFGTVTASLNTQFEQNSYLAGQSNSRNMTTQISLGRAAGTLSQTLQANLAQSDYGAGKSSNLTSSFDQTIQPNPDARFETRFDYSQFSSPSFAGFGGTDRRELDTNLDYARRGSVYDLEILGSKYTQLGSSTNGTTSFGSGGFFGGVERLPEVRLATDAARLTALQRFLPATSRLDLSLGDFNEPSSLTSTQRARFGLDLGQNTHTLNGRNRIDYGGSFVQELYGDNTAQYVLTGRSAYRLRIGSNSTGSVSYTYLRPYGFTPFEFDIAGNTNLAAVSLNYHETPQFQLTAATGYDLNRTRGQFGLPPTPWQNIAVQTLYTPYSGLRLRTTGAYDINRERLLDLTSSLRVRGQDSLALDLSTRFAPAQHKFSNINGQLNLPFFRDPREDAGYRLQAIGGYNGFTNRFDYKGLALRRSWHDYEASLIYQDNPLGLRPGASISFNFRLKAFPAEEPFAVGQFGQALDPNLGEVY